MEGTARVKRWWLQGWRCPPPFFLLSSLPRTALHGSLDDAFVGARERRANSGKRGIELSKKEGENGRGKRVDFRLATPFPPSFLPHERQGRFSGRENRLDSRRNGRILETQEIFRVNRWWINMYIDNGCLSREKMHTVHESSLYRACKSIIRNIDSRLLDYLILSVALVYDSCVRHRVESTSLLCYATSGTNRFVETIGRREWENRKM